MRVEAELKEYAPQRETVLTIGVFDGVHLGHRQLMDYLKRQAMSKEYLPGLVTFRSHPLHTISPESPISYLTSLDERIRLIRQQGIDLVVPLSFDRDLAQIPARRFVSLLQEHLKMRGLVVGPDFALGQKREGNVSALRKLGKDLGFWVDVIRPEMINGEVVSSTAIRKALASGDITKVSRLLGRPFALSGKIAYGRGRGRQLGFPTANLEVSADHAIPADGVYATRARLAGGVYGSVTNIGRRPTFGAGERTVETYLVGYDGVAYEEELHIDFVERLRPERRFENADELAAQMKKDVEQAVAILARAAA
ncbi:MAG: bifunctional riboflavin kinase/FAD synthetase [Chloroflexi bacterium]|nr:bifunctional riboflavin kinase/FAD synthetase [Chloroflexota bacterium]